MTRPTPPLPDWIRSARVPGYITAHVRLPGVTRLFGTETLYGDWDGQVLLLAKDFAASRVLEERLARGEPDPYRHGTDSESLTNRRPKRFLPLLGCGSGSEGFLYGSALANLLREDGEMSGSLPNRREALPYGMAVLTFVVSHMPNLRVILCMGWEARVVRDRAAQEHEGVRRVQAIDVPHPAARKSLAEHEARWRAAGTAMRGA